MGAAKKKSTNYVKMIDIDTLKTDVLNAVTEDGFDTAIEHLQAFLSQPTEYPQFRYRMERLVIHAIDLVNAIRAKKNFPGMSSLTRSKQQELAERTNSHFNELQSTMVKMARIMNQIRSEDVRSTLWIMRALVYGVGLIIIIAFVKEITSGLWNVFESVAESSIDKSIDVVYKLF